MSEISPIVLSAVICDRVIFDKITGMPSLINIIQSLNAPQYPLRHSTIVFFCEMTNGHGVTKTKIRLVDVAENERIIFEQAGSVEFKDVKQILTLALNLQGVVFPRPGEYCFQLFTGDELIAERRIICRKVKLPPKTGQQPA